VVSEENGGIEGQPDFYMPNTLSVDRRSAIFRFLRDKYRVTDGVFPRPGKHPMWLLARRMGYKTIKVRIIPAPTTEAHNG
jgi:hypothetical protein